MATASLEMGIDIGYIDLVCQIGSTRSIATFLQRVGRAGHSLGKIPKGRLFPLIRDELLESLALVPRRGPRALDAIEIPDAPLDILAQQIVAAVACEEWDEDDLFDLCAGPGRFASCAGGLRRHPAPAQRRRRAGIKRGAYLHRDRINGRLRARRGAGWRP